MRCWFPLFVCALVLSGTARAGPVDFGMAEVNAALASRNLRWKVKTELNLEGPETYRIEPYGYGGGYVTGGDLRGLMYGLLEAADQIRATGRMTLSHAAPAIPLRGVRMFLEDVNLDPYSEDYWRAYFQTLARSRLNHFSLIFLSANPLPLLVEVKGVQDPSGMAERRERNLHMLRFISQTAAEYAVDFTVGFWDPGAAGNDTHDALLNLLTECPAIRNVEMRAQSADPAAYRDSVFKALHEVGRRVALEPRGVLLDPAMRKAAEEAGVALRISPDSWPPGFEIDGPVGASHEVFYWMWGRLAYDPKTKPPRALPAAEFRDAALLVAELRNALLADPNAHLWPRIPAASIVPESPAKADDFVMTVPEAVRARLDHAASAKLTPLDIADALSAGSTTLDKSAIPDFQLLAELARYHAHRLRAAYYVEMFDQLRNPAALERAAAEMKNAVESWTSGESPLEDADVLEKAVEQRRASTDIDRSREIPALLTAPPRPQITHAPVKIVTAGQPITLTMQINPVKDVRVVRMHYRAKDAAAWTTLEKTAPPFAFTIPAADLVADTQMVYYFEILNRQNSGWFEPDPLTAIPYHEVRVVPK